MEIALIFLIALLSVLMTIMGIQVFFILRDLKKALDRLNKIIESGDEIAKDIERPIGAASNLVTALTNGAKALIKKESKVKAKRFYKKVL